jgi:hypothetical protein
MNLHDLYKIVESDYTCSLNRLNDYIKLARSLNIAEDKYELDSVYVALLRSVEDHKFAKTIILQNLGINPVKKI